LAGIEIPCVVYAAKSTEDKRGSIPDQLADCRGVIEAEPDRNIVGEFTDEAFSAFSGNRGPGLVEAMQRVEDLAREGGAVELWAQHSDRLARGDGRSARHAVEIALWALKRDVRVRTVQDPDTFRDLLYAVVTGQRNHEDSRRKGLAVAAGRRRAAVRGDYLGYKPDGYRLAVEVDKRGQVAKRLVIDSERQPAIELIFRLARLGKDTGAIARESTPYIFNSIDGRRLNKSNLNYAFRPVAMAWAAAGHEPIDLYTLRHVGLTAFLERGVSPSDAAVQAGHEDGGALIMERYGHPSKDRARERLKKAFDDDRRPKSGDHARKADAG
jgi:DNA invertase Pin-like site-specific DNA recombinase